MSGASPRKILLRPHWKANSQTKTTPLFTLRRFRRHWLLEECIPKGTRRFRTYRSFESYYNSPKEYHIPAPWAKKPVLFRLYECGVFGIIDIGSAKISFSALFLWSKTFSPHPFGDCRDTPSRSRSTSPPDSLRSPSSGLATRRSKRVASAYARRFETLDSHFPKSA